MGRHLVACREIRVGEVVGREVAAACLPLGPLTDSHCATCMVGLGDRSLPCTNCQVSKIDRVRDQINGRPALDFWQDGDFWQFCKFISTKV